MSLSIVLSDDLIKELGSIFGATNDEEIQAVFKLFQNPDFLDRFFENCMDFVDKGLDIYFISEQFYEFIDIVFLGSIKSYLDKEEYPPHLGELIDTWHDFTMRVKRGCAKLINKLPPGELSLDAEKEQLRGKISEVLKIVKKIDRQTEHGHKVNDKPLTDLQRHLMQIPLVLSDGITANGSLKDIACEVVKYNKNKPVTWQYLQDNFVKRNGKKYSQGTCENARDYANT